MGSGTGSIGAGYWLTLAFLAAVAALLAHAGGLRLSRAVVTAALRAAAQLAAVSLVIVAVLRAWGLTVAFVLVMLVVASATSARRIHRRRRDAAWAGAAITLAVAPVLAVVLATGTVPARPVAVVPLAGILIGGAMTATSLAGRRAIDDLTVRRGEHEALLALGFPGPDAVRELCRPGIAQALHPALDQTRTVGLVTLPGAYVGVLLGGGDPVQAAAVQLLVLIGLLAVEVIAVLVVTELVAHRLIHHPGTTTPGR
ncbi:MAG TPA: ABC transporter permease [Pseudonocardiaceae bacterium]